MNEFPQYSRKECNTDATINKYYKWRRETRSYAVLYLNWFIVKTK